MSTVNTNSYGRILKTSSLLGGASAVNVISGIVRTKIVALKLGPSLFGVMSLYTTLTTMISSVSSLGIDRSAVRDIAEAAGSGDEIRIAHTIVSLRRTVWITGLSGLFATVLLAVPASYWTFGNYRHVGVIAALSVTVLLAQVQAGQMALLQGLRMIRELTVVQVMGAVWSTLLAIPILLIWQEKGIAPFMIAVALAQALTGWWYARRVTILSVTLSWRETLKHSQHMISLGLALVGAGIATSLSLYLIRLIIQRNDGEAGVGLYQAAFAISNVYVGFVLQAMAGDYYPRLAGVGEDVIQRNQLVNEQAEIAILLAVPGLVAAMVFSETLLWLLYSSRFEGASAVLRWQVLGLLGRIIIWPVGFVLLARGDKKAFLMTEIISAAVHVGLVYVGVKWYGVTGAGVAFAALYVFYVILIRGVVWRRHAYQWTCGTRNLLLMGTAVVGVGFMTTFISASSWRLVSGLGVLAVAAAMSMGGIYRRMGKERVARVWQLLRGYLGYGKAS